MKLLSLKIGFTTLILNNIKTIKVKKDANWYLEIDNNVVLVRKNKNDILKVYNKILEILEKNLYILYLEED